MHFREVAGHTELKKGLIEGVSAGRIPHAQLFLGPEGSGNLALAFAYAQYISCTDKTPDDSCGACNSCRKYNQMVHPDLHFSFPFITDPKEKDETCSDVYITQWRSTFLANPYLNLFDWMAALKAEDKQPNINSFEARKIIKKLSLKAFESYFKVLIMWLPEFLGPQSNILLKLIEEPPLNTIFLLCANNEDRLLPTIISRTQLVKCKPYLQTEIADWLVINKNVETELAGNIAVMASGNIHKAIELSGEVSYTQFENFRNWLNVCVRGNYNDVQKWVDSVVENGKDSIKAFAQYALFVMRARLVSAYNIGGNQLTEQELELVQKFAARFPEKNVEIAYRELNNVLFGIERNGNPKFILVNLTFAMRKLLIN